MANIKHIGRLRNNKRRVIVAYRTLPGDARSALVVFTDSLPSDEHDALINLVESNVGQDAYELAEAMARSWLPDGRVMLTGFHNTGRLAKIATKDIEMTPNINSSIALDELNEVVAKQRGIGIEDLALRPTESQDVRQANQQAQAVTAIPAVEPLTDEDIARSYRGQADALYKEARRLREEAEKLSPTKRKTPTVKE